MSNTGWAAVVLAIVIILGLGWWWYATQQPVPPGTDLTTTQPTGTGQPDNTLVGGDASVDVGVGDASTRVEVHYSAAGFSPKSVTVVKGTAVTFINDTAGPMWVASNNHPTHTQYDSSSEQAHCSGAYTGATPFDQCQGGSTYTFVFSKAGTFDYHNHLAAQFEGAVVVQ